MSTFQRSTTFLTHFSRKKEAEKKVQFPAWIKWNAERRRSICDWICTAFLKETPLKQFSQNLIQIYGQSAFFWWFVRKQNAFYGQTAIFDHFVRNRHFSSEPFTDRRPIFIYVSVNDSAFAKCSARQISAPSSHSNLTPASFRLLSCIRKKPD